jgi:Ni/Fe-hydrogenase subunit HybB-like protein
MFVTDHSIVAWDLSMAIVPGWHSAIMGPYFISGAVYSGLAAVVLTMAALRWVFRLGDYLTRDHFDVVARFLLLSASVWLFFFITHVLLSLRGADPVELRIWEQRLLPAPYTGLSVVFLLTAFVIPVPFWLVRRCRRSPTIMFCTALLVTIGLWLERYLLIMPPLSYKHPFVFTWDAFYEPSLIEYLLILAPFALVALGLLAFAKLFPIVPLYEVREGALLERRVQIGAAEVPAYIRETLEVRS